MKGQVTFKLNKVKTLSNQKNFGEGTSRNGEGSSRQCVTPLASGKVKEKTVSPKWTKSKIPTDKLAKGKSICEFRLWVSWMGSENSFRIMSLKVEHRCARNYNLGSLVTYKWIAHQFAKEIIEDPFITLLKMKAAIWEKFLINVSLGQCKRAKQRALYNFEGGLIEHYGRLWDYMQAVLDTNPGLTCILEEEEIEHGNKYFHKMYICFKGVAYGWKAGYRRVIWLDGCFLKHTCKGELLTAVGRDANNQMYPIAWAVVRVENNLNCRSFNRAILVQRTKLVITMLEDIRLYIMQRLVHVYNKSMQLEDRITPSIRKRLEILKEQQRLWTVITSRFQEQEVRRGDESYGVNIHLKKCMCRLWELS
ncbi:calcium/proton exchanger, partial [Tanacetum coccineum]